MQQRTLALIDSLPAQPRGRAELQQSIDDLFANASHTPVPLARLGLAPDTPIVPVSRTTFDRMNQGLKIAHAVAPQVMNGNRLSVMQQTRGTSNLLLDHTRDLQDRYDQVQHEPGTTKRSESAVMAETGTLSGGVACEEGAHIVAQVASSLGIPCAVMGHPDQSHSFTVLFHNDPDPSRQVVVDTHSRYPTVCPLDQYKFWDGTCQTDAEFTGRETPTFDFARTLAARQDLASHFGEGALEQQLLQQRMATSTAPDEASFRQRLVHEARNLTELVGRPSVQLTEEATSHLVHRGTQDDNDDAQDAAEDAATRSAGQRAFAQAKQSAHTAAVESGTEARGRATVEAVERRSEGAATAEGFAEAHAEVRMKPWAWTNAYNAKAAIYQAPGGEPANFALRTTN